MERPFYWETSQAFFEAARRGDAAFLKEFLETYYRKYDSILAADWYHDYDNGARPQLKTTPLILAVQSGNLECVKILLKYKAEIEERGGYIDGYYPRCTPLFVAAANGNVDILSFLVEGGADVNSRSGEVYEQLTPLMVACENGKLNAVLYLTDEGAEVNLEDVAGYTALHYAATFSGNNNALSCLIDSRANVNALTDDNRTPLMLACEYGHLVNCLLQNGAYVDFQDDDGQTALYLATYSERNRFDNLSSLIRYGADVNTADIRKCTPLMQASQFCDVEEVTLLIEHGAKVELQDQNGDTALHYAARVEKATSANLCKLLTAGASLLCENSQGLTPLLDTSNEGNIEIVECLIKQPEITKEQRIDALELLGSSLCLDFDVDDVENGFKYIERGMLERFADPTHPLLKRQMEPVEAYQNRKESQTLEELAQIEGDKNAIIMESLVLRERVLGRNHVQLLEPIRFAANYYKHRSSFSVCIMLYRHAMKIAQYCDQSAIGDLDHITSLLRSWLDSDLPKDKVFTELLEQTVLDHLNEMQRKVTKERDEDLFDSFFRVVNVMNQLMCDKEEKLSNAAVLFKTICKSNPRDYNGNTLLHYFVRHHIYNFSHSCTNALKLLLNAGFDVNGVNKYGDTPLHLAVTFKPWNDGKTDMLQVLFNGGAHHDFVNSDGKTPTKMAETNEARMILMKRRKLELKCITARAVKKFRIPYLGVVPKTLEKYISMH